MASELDVRTILDAAPVAMLIVGVEGRIEWVNGEAVAMFGWTADELIGEPVAMLIPERLRAVHAEHLRDFVRRPIEQQQRVPGRVLTARRKDASELCVEISLRTVRPRGTICALIDVTERVRVESHLEVAQRLAAVGSYEVELSGTHLYGHPIARMSDEMYRILGYAPGEFTPTGETFRAMVHPDDLAHVDALVAAAFSGEPTVTDYRMIRRDGSVIVVRTASEVERDASGKPVYLRGITRDVTAERAAQQIARDEHARLQALIAHAPDFIFELDLEGRVRWINRSVPPLGDEQLYGKPIDAMTLGGYGEQFRAALRRVIEQRVSAALEVPSALIPGAWFSLHIGPIVRDDVVVGVIGVSRDVTTKRDTESKMMIADRLASVGTLAAGVAHEINNPLASLIANLELVLRDLSDRQVPAETQDQLRDAAQAAERVREIVRDLKLFSRVEDERRIAVDVARTVRSTLRLAMNLLRERAQLVLDLAEVPPVLANEARVGQVVLNLVLNAVQAIPEADPGRHQIRVATRSDGDRVEIVVADTGVGIPLEIRGRLFDPFFTTKPVGEGTGLGLPICHRIVTALGGEIRFTSELGRGTEFVVSLPRAPVAVPEPAPPAPAAAPRTHERRARILVVDDEPLITRTITRIIGGDHDVTAVGDGHAALREIGTGVRYDVILCDLMMPQMSGMDVYAEVARRNPAQAERIVFMTGGAFSQRARDFLATTTNPQLDKPFDAAKLRAVIAAMLA